jgi:hypothetical protein
MSKAAAKVERVRKAIAREEPDRVPIGEFFWTNFLRRARDEGHAGEGFNAYNHWDHDLIVINPNMDPHLTGIQVIEDTDERRVVKTGFACTIEQRADYPMPAYVKFDTESYEQIAAFRFDDPADERRYHVALDDQINSVTDALNLGLPSFVDRVNGCANDFAVFGSVCEPHEMLWRIIGTENALFKIAEEPGKVAAFIERLGDFLVGIVHAQVEAAKGNLTGLYVWGDIAYVKGMLFSPDYWRKVYKPQLKRIIDAAHEHDLLTIYHGCGNASRVFEDMIEVGVDAYNPLEAKAGLDVVELKRQYKNRWSFNGNIDVRILASNDRDKIRREVLTKLNAAKGGGYIIQSDHSVPTDVDFDSYDYMVQLVREYGNYPLDLGEYDVEI